MTHVDYSAPIQTVQRKTNLFYHDLLAAFFRKTGYPVAVNTSFNVRGEPIVFTTQDAYRCFMRTARDAPVLEYHLLLRDEQPEWREEEEWRKTFTLE